MRLGFTRFVGFAGASIIASSVFGTGGFSGFVFIVFRMSLLPLATFVALVSRIGPNRSRFRYVAAAIFFAALIYQYGTAVVDVRTSTSSTAGLIYLFLPAYMMVAALGSVLVAWGVDRVSDLARPRATR